MLRDVNFAYRIHPAAQNEIGEQQWLTGLIVYQYGNYLYPGQYSNGRLDGTAFGAETFSWQDPVHSWKAGPGEVMTGKFIWLLANEI